MSLTKSGIWYPDGNFTANPRVIAAQQAANLESVISNERLRYGSVEFASTAARDVAFPIPQQGDECSINGSPMIYVTNKGWVYLKTAANMQSTRTEVSPLSGTTTGTTHVIVVPLTEITAVDYPRIFTVHLCLCMNVFPASGSGQGLLFYDGVMVKVVRLISAAHVGSINWAVLVPANTTHNFQVNINLTATSGTGTLYADGRFSSLIYVLQPA